jgi:putative nucleotidyltransferase with HDIG domain
VNRNQISKSANAVVPDPAIRRAELRALIPQLPVFPVCAAEVIRASSRGYLTAEQLISLASKDQVLAGGLLQAANSASNSWSGRVTSVKQAVMHLGEIRAAQLLVAAAMKPILAVVGHQKLWEHSLEAAAVAQKLAFSSKLFDPAGAYVLALLHDVGELLLRLTPLEARTNLHELVAAGCERSVAELLIFGATHGQAGADVLRHWCMPETYIRAVEYHHDPETGGDIGAALLYLTEQWTEPNGDRLREDRLQHSLGVLQLPEVFPHKCPPGIRI